MTRVVAFDVNETLLDLLALDDTFERLLGSASQRAAWFAQMLQLSFVAGLTGEYIDFTTAQRGALTMLAQRRDRPLTLQDVTEALEPGDGWDGVVIGWLRCWARSWHGVFGGVVRP